MSDPLTPTQRLAEHLLGRSLLEYVTEKRNQERPRWSWQAIADQLKADTEGQVAVSREVLRSWYADTEVAA